VWWDHTIPPGRTWETYIARAINEARCCIVVWSAHSIASDWVKEEATLAKESGKYLPVAIDDEQPAMGFRRIQAAQLKGWRGDRANAQWQLLVRVVREMLGAPTEPFARPPTPAPTAAPSPSTFRPRALWALLGGVAAAGLLVVVLFVATSNSPPESTPVTETAPAVSDNDEEPATEIGAVYGVDTDDIERMQRERDQALERERAQREEIERLRRANNSLSNNAPPRTGWRNMAGEWQRVSGTGCSLFYQFTVVGNGLRWESASSSSATYSIVRRESEFEETGPNVVTYATDRIELIGDELEYYHAISNSRCRYQRLSSATPP